MSVDFKLPEYTANLPRWQQAENITSARNVEQYLIELNPTDDSQDNKSRNVAYKERAVLYQVAGYTMKGLVGLLLQEPPVVTMPTALSYLEKNVDGAGLSLFQQAQDVSGDQIKKGRAGLLVSYPKAAAESSRADLAEKGIVATITKIDATQIINWREETTDGQVKRTLVVIKEVVQKVQADGFTVKDVDQMRELRLVDGVFKVQLWRKKEEGSQEAGDWETFEKELTPTDSKGKTWDEIPFEFVGAETNTPSVDDAPLHQIVIINTAHYRNSADWEDTIWYAGQAQPWMSGVTQGHIDLMKASEMYVGARTLLGVPAGETFGFESADANPVVRQAMADKIDMMVGLGARFIMDPGAAKTATEASIDAKGGQSTLSTIGGNLGDAYETAIGWVARFMGTDGEIKFEVNRDFVAPDATAQEIQAMVAGFIQGAIPMADYFAWLQRRGVVESDRTLEEFKEEVNPAPAVPLDDEEGEEGGVDEQEETENQDPEEG